MDIDARYVDAAIRRWQIFTGRDAIHSDTGLTFDEQAARGDAGTCPYRKSNPYVLMVQPAKDRPRFDAPSTLNEPSNRRILA
jgi:hypothetical protein